MDETFELPLDAGSPREARRLIRDRFGASDRCDDLLLCVSEVVSNALLHARSAPRLSFARHGSVVRIEVADDDPSAPVRRPHSAEATTGRGLLILDRMADRWGVTPATAGKVVWFEIDLGAAS